MKKYKQLQDPLFNRYVVKVIRGESLYDAEIVIDHSIHCYVERKLRFSLPLSDVRDVWFGCRHSCFKSVKVKWGFCDDALTIGTPTETIGFVFRKDYARFVRELQNLV